MYKVIKISTKETGERYKTIKSILTDGYTDEIIRDEKGVLEFVVYDFDLRMLRNDINILQASGFDVKEISVS